MPSSEITAGSTLRELVATLPDHYYIVRQYKDMEGMFTLISLLAEFKPKKENKDQKKLL